MKNLESKKLGTLLILESTDVVKWGDNVNDGMNHTFMMSDINHRANTIVFYNTKTRQVTVLKNRLEFAVKEIKNIVLAYMKLMFEETSDEPINSRFDILDL